MADFDYSGLVDANGKLTELANQVRNVTGETSTLSIEGMTEALAALNLINYGTVKAGSTSIPATTQGDTLSLVAGTGITLAGDATNKKITISSSSSESSFGTMTSGSGRLVASSFDSGTYQYASENYYSISFTSTSLTLLSLTKTSYIVLRSLNEAYLMGIFEKSSGTFTGMVFGMTSATISTAWSYPVIKATSCTITNGYQGSTGGNYAFTQTYSFSTSGITIKGPDYTYITGYSSNSAPTTSQMNALKPSSITTNYTYSYAYATL